MPKLRPTGRHELARVPEPAAGYPALPVSARNGEIAAVAVADPYDPQRQVRALARLDLLDRERRAHRIDEAAYLTGRMIEAEFQVLASPLSGGGQWMEGDRVDAVAQSELRMVLGLERAAKLVALTRWITARVGGRDARLLWLVLGAGLTFGQAGACFGRTGWRGQLYTADRFREALSVLADARAAKGKAR